MLYLDRIIGNLNDPDLHEKLHGFEHANKLEFITLDKEDIKRRRIRTSTNCGTDCAITLNRSDTLENGSVLFLDASRAIVVRLPTIEWLVLVPGSVQAALELGYFVGNLHWQVEVIGDRLHIAVEGSKAAYLDRLQPFLSMGQVEQVTN
ncbi:MAG: urease accessory protein UreE [Elainellaceae cyanobacterium]